MSNIPSSKEYEKYKKDIEDLKDLEEVKKIALKLLRENFKLKLKLTKAGLVEKHIIYIIDMLDKSVGYLAMRFNTKNVGILLAANVCNFFESFFIAYKQIETLCEYEFEERALIDEVFSSLKGLCTVLKTTQSTIRGIVHRYEEYESRKSKRAPQDPFLNRNISENHRNARDSVDDSGAESVASGMTEVSNFPNILAKVFSGRDVDYEEYYNQKKSTVNSEADVETSALSDSSRNEVENDYSQRKKKSSVNSVKRRGRKRANQTVENRENKRRHISTDSRNESVISPRKHKAVFRGHKIGASPTENLQESTSNANDEMSPSEDFVVKSGRRTSISILENDVNDKKGRRRNSKTLQNEMHDEELSPSRPKSYDKVPRGIRQKIKGDLALSEDKMQLKKYNITKKLIVKVTDYFKGCPDKSDASNGVEAEPLSEAPAGENNIDAARSREVNSSRESEEYEILDEVGDDNNGKDNNSEPENNERDSLDDACNESVKSSVCGSENSNAEINSDPVFSEETKEDKSDKASVKSNDEGDDEMEAEEGEEEEEEEEEINEEENDDNCGNKNSDSESEKSSETPKKKSAYGKRGPRTPPMPPPFILFSGPRTPEGPSPVNAASDSEDSYCSSVSEK